MISIDPTTQGERDNYKLLIGSIIPRPIALVSTLSQDGVLNAAPFSYFSIVSSNPPMISVSVQRKNGIMKDTARNAVARGELVAHVMSESHVEALNQTAANLSSDESEVTHAGFTTIASEAVAVPGIAEAKVRIECQIEHALELGGKDGRPGCDLLICRIVRYHFAEDVYDNGHILADKLSPVSRLAGNYYASLGRMFEIERPQ